MDRFCRAPPFSSLCALLRRTGDWSRPYSVVRPVRLRPARLKLKTPSPYYEQDKGQDKETEHNNADEGGDDEVGRRG